MEPFLGQIQAFGFNFAPRGWAQCNGQLLPINQNSALFSLLGTIYGGDGRTTFGLPDLRGRYPMHFGQGNGLSDRKIGVKSGVENVTLSLDQIPSHTHATTIHVADSGATSSKPTNNVLASGQFYTGPSGSQTLAPAAVTVANSGGSQAHGNMPPFQVVNWCIAIQGLFPSRT